MAQNRFAPWRRALSLVLCLLLLLSVLLPLAAHAQESNEKVVRVGWYESAFHHTDSFGRRSGYGYTYQQRLAIYTGWTYEYVQGSWSELLEMLVNGEIDLLSDVSYTPERSERILYSDEAMCSEGYHIFIAPDNTEIRPDDFSTLNGKRVAVNKNSVQEQLLLQWAKTHHVNPEVVSITEQTPVQMEMLASGELDALVTLDTYANAADVVPVWKVGGSEGYFGINKNRPDLKQELDAAMARLFEDNRNYNQQLAEKYNQSGTVNSFLTSGEKVWLYAHGPIRVGYRNDFLPFCDLDEETGELTGALSDFLVFAQTCEKNATLTFETRAFSSTEQALHALADGEIDCVFPLSLSAYDGEKHGVIITDPFITTEMYAAVRTLEHQGVSRDREMTAAVIRGNPNYESFLMDNFPNWKILYFENGTAAFQAVSAGMADCCLVSNYRISRVSEQLSKYQLSALATGKAMDMSLAVRREDDRLYSIMNKVIRLIPDATVTSTLTGYAFRDERITFGQYLQDNLVNFVACIASIAVVILLLVLKNMKTNAKMREGRRIISETERDPVTNLYNWNYFLLYANRLYREHPEKPMDAVYMNIDHFHSVNALHGRTFGDDVLKAIGEEIQQLIAGTDGIATRVEADRFQLYCEHREDWQAQLNRFQQRLDSLLHNASVHLRMGVKPAQAGMEPVLQFDCARTACNKVRGDFTAQAVIYDEAMEQQEERDQRLLNDLNRALEQRELEVYYQPKYSIQGTKPALSSAEALVRWKHPEMGMIPPGVFIPLFEHSGQISALDNYVWAEAARQIAEWRDQYGVTLPVSVNLSRVDVFDPELTATLDALVARYGLRCGDLKLEVTESAYTENADQLIQVIKTLQGKGYEIEMDDFGSGYSSLNMLSSIPIDVLKMDIAFIRNIERDEKDMRLVELILDIARYLNVPVVAEGVENARQLDLLRSAGCDLVQGYYFSRPLPAREFARTILTVTALQGGGVE